MVNIRKKIGKILEEKWERISKKKRKELKNILNFIAQVPQKIKTLFARKEVVSKHFWDGFRFAEGKILLAEHCFLIKNRKN